MPLFNTVVSKQFSLKAMEIFTEVRDDALYTGERNTVDDNLNQHENDKQRKIFARNIWSTS